jgi:hypothetical protein
LNGFIESPGYPNYISGVTNCFVKVLPKSGYGLSVYIVEVRPFSMNQKH